MAAAVCDPAVIGGLALLQSALAAMPTPGSVVSLVEAGLARVPGIALVRLSVSGAPLETARGDVPSGTERIWLDTLSGRFGWLDLTIADPAAFAPYDPYVRNLANAIGLQAESVHQQERLARMLAEQQRTDEALRASEQRLRAMFERAAIGIVELDAGGRFVAVNDRMCEIVRRPRHELLAMSVHDLTAPEDRALTVESHRRLRDGGSDVCEYEKRYLRRDGTPVWVHVTVAGLHDAGGAYGGAIGTVADITERRAAADERDALLDAIREADRRKSEFLGMLSHELRNPLAPIRNSLYILTRAAPGGEQAMRALAVIDRQVLHVTRLVDDLLDVTRITRGKVRLERERLELGTLARRTAEDHRALFARNGVELAVETSDGEVVVNADPTRIAQVIGNLLQNAVKFTPRGGRTILSVATADGLAVITVQDTGAGIAAATLPRLFQPFVQAESTLDRSAGGLGLGLSLVKGLVELHGGSVSAHSEGPGEGATFVARLPLEGGATSRAVVPPRAPSSRRRRVLVIEDNVDAAETLKEALELDDHLVDVALTGPEGLERARALRPDVVVCDIGLPGMDGFQVARRMRATPQLRGVPLIALSGYAQPEDLERSRQAGFDLHLAKPPDLRALERAIAQATARASVPTRVGVSSPGASR